MLNAEQVEMMDRAAAEGAKLLDKVTPKWFERVSLPLLNMAKINGAGGTFEAGLLMQLYGKHLTGLKVLGIRPCSMESSSHGFCVECDEQPTDRLLKAALTNAWKNEILQRLPV